ncbi:MAG TPA: glycosyltransferase, partial [Blastocatellia bacterium]|nr:glycosyltransferase [Blastocatellia bacterium]
SVRKALAPNGERIILHVSTFRPIKRITDCIEIIARMKTMEPQSSRAPVRLIMCGDGPERADAEALAEKLNVSESVTFVGKQPQSQVREYLSVSDLLLLPSRSESFGLTALEAMACEVPVIATRVGGIPELVEDGGCGYLFDVGDVDGMAAAALRVINDDGERERLGTRGRQIAVSRFRVENIIPQYEDLYRRVVNV